MQGKMKDCFTPHAFMHNFMGLGFGLILAALFSGLRSVWLGILVIVVAAVLDYRRK